MSQKGTKIHTAGIAADPAFADRDLLASRACKLFGMSCPIEVAETSAHLPDNLFRIIICTGGFFRTPGLGLVVVVAPEGGTLQCQKMRDEAQASKRAASRREEKRRVGKKYQVSGKPLLANQSALLHTGGRLVA